MTPSRDKPFIVGGTDSDTLEARGQRAMKNYRDGEREEHAGRAKQLQAIVEYGQVLQEGRKQRDDNAFGAWIVANSLDVGSPWNQRQERSNAMKIAKIVGVGTTTYTPFEGCPNTTPTNIMKWYRAQQAPKPDKPVKTPQTDAAQVFIRAAKARGEAMPGKKELAKKLNISHMAVEKAIDREREREEAKADQDEMAEVDAAYPTFSEKSKMSVQSAINALKKRQARDYEAYVDAEVRRRIALADDAVRKHYEELKIRCAALEKKLSIMQNSKGVFTKTDFRQLQMCCHPDSSAGPEIRARLLQVLVENELRLVKAT